MGKQTLGKWVIGGLSGIFGLSQIPHESSENKPVSAAVSFENETDSSGSNTKDDSTQKPNSENPSDLAKATEAIESLKLKHDLPALKGMPEQPVGFTEAKRVNPFENIEGLQKALEKILAELHIPVVRRNDQTDPNSLAENTLGISLLEQNPDDPSLYQLNVDFVSDQTWKAAFQLVWHQDVKTFEILPDVSLLDLLDPMTSINEDENMLQANILKQIQLMQLANAYLHAGMPRDEIRAKLKDQAKEEKEKTQKTIAQK